MGTVIAYFSYRQYYPSLASPMSHRPYSPRVPRDEQVLPTVAPHGESRFPDRESEEGEEVELIDGAVRNPEPEPLKEVWQRGDNSTSDHV